MQHRYLLSDRHKQEDVGGVAKEVLDTMETALLDQRGEHVLKVTVSPELLALMMLYTPSPIGVMAETIRYGATKYAFDLQGTPLEVNPKQNRRSLVVETDTESEESLLALREELYWQEWADLQHNTDPYLALAAPEEKEMHKGTLAYKAFVAEREMMHAMDAVGTGIFEIMQEWRDKKNDEGLR